MDTLFYFHAIEQTPKKRVIDTSETNLSLDELHERIKEFTSPDSGVTLRSFTFGDMAVVTEVQNGRGVPGPKQIVKS